MVSIDETKYDIIKRNNSPKLILNKIKRPGGYQTPLPYCDDHFLKLVLVENGKGTWKIEQKKYNFKKNDIIIFNNIEKRTQKVNENIDFYALIISFEPNFIRQIQSFLNSDYLKIFFHRKKTFKNVISKNTDEKKECLNLFKKIKLEHKNKPKDFKQNIILKLMNILLYTNRYFDKHVTDKEKINNKHLSDMNRVINHIEEHLEEKIYLSDLAKIAKMNPTYFSSKFKEFNGICVSEYIQKRRIQKALRLLKNTNKNILTIALNCGFKTHSNFYRAFKKLTGNIPSYYR
ncbi:MAG: helix-turn-helix transcriptional regulator [Candidatus Woesearchaeota archaeon]